MKATTRGIRCCVYSANLSRSLGPTRGGIALDTLTAYTKHLEEMVLLSSALAVLEWDQETHLAPHGVESRSRVVGRLTKQLHELGIAPELGGYLETLRGDDSLTPVEQASVRVIGKAYDRRRAVPPTMVEEHAAARSKAQAAWAEARERSDFSIFESSLATMVDFARRFAELYGYDAHPYDALIDEYEPGMTTAALQSVMGPLRERLVPFIRRLVDEGTPPDADLVEGDFPIPEQRRLAQRALEAIGYDFNAGGLDDVEHPFTIAIAYGDVRVTNQYKPDRLAYGLFGVLHEGGHALYHQGMPEELYRLGLEEGASAGIDEAQALLVENQLGRGLPFWKGFHPTLVEVFPSYRTASPEALYRAVNRVAPSLIRVAADEVTYNLHIMLRFELEVGLISGDIDVHDLPALWNEAMERYVGLVPPNDALGVLQDIHWAFGYFGYFPSYLLGTLYAAQLSAVLRAAVPDLDQQLADGEFTAFTRWLREAVHRHGAVYEPADLIERVTGAPLNAGQFLDYVADKYSEIYGVT